MRRECIIAAAIFERDQVDLAFFETLGTFEQHVLQKMGLSGLAQLLVA